MFRLMGRADAAEREAMFYAFALVLQLHMTVSIGLWAWLEHDDWRQLAFTLPGLAALHLVATRTHLRAGLMITAALALTEHVGTPIAILPQLIANHNFLEYCCIGVLLFVGTKDAEQRELGLATLQWLVVITIFASGMQKLWHGSYLHGDFLSWSISRGRWQESLGALLDPAELERLRSYTAAPFQFTKDQLVSPRPGPYRTPSTMLTLISNSVWLLEICLPIALVVRRTRTIALLALLGMFAAFLVVVREAFFGLLVVNLLLLFAPRNCHRSAFPFFILGYAVILSAQLGALPFTLPR